MVQGEKPQDESVVQEEKTNTPDEKNNDNKPTGENIGDLELQNEDALPRATSAPQTSPVGKLQTKKKNYF